MTSEEAGETVALARRSLREATAEAFMDRVRAQAADLKEAIAAGDLDNEGFAVGLEMEVYAVERGEAGPGECRLARLPEAVFGDPPTKELGLHNAEINTEPDRFDGEGLAAQAEGLAADLEAARAAARARDRELVLDAMWTVPPAGGSRAYLSANREDAGVVLAENMREDPRYCAIDNDALRLAGGAIPFEVPGAHHRFPTILFESLATSIQPHLQVPTAAAFPAHYNAAIRTLGPLLALSTNSPFLPPDLYNRVEDPAALVEETHHELRIAAFEQSVNHSPEPKVRVPRDITDATEVVDRVVADALYAPFLREWLEATPRESFLDRHWEFDYKRTTYWRWLRCVVGGDPVPGAGDERSLRIEYRPLPTQPTVRDVLALQALTAGLVRGLVAADHPITELPWRAARESFYDAVANGIEADLAWVTADGERTRDTGAILEEVLAYAREGLPAAGVARGDADRYLAPIEARVAARATPSTWKRDRVREALSDGATLSAAITDMQREYVRLSRETDSFAEWL